LDVFDFTLSVGHHHWRHYHHDDNMGESDEDAAILQHYDAGLLLKRFSNKREFVQYQDMMAANKSMCSFESFRTPEKEYMLFDDDRMMYQEDDDEFYYMDQGDILNAAIDGIYLPLRHNRTSKIETANHAMANIQYMFQQGEEGLYILMYQVCPKHDRESITDRHVIRSTFELDFHYKNVDSLHHDSYLTAGEMPLPTVFLYFFVSYAACTFAWMSNIWRIEAGLPGVLGARTDVGRPKVYAIHQLMSVLLMLKTLSVLFESVRYHYIRLTGHAELWSIVYYGVTFLKGMFLFTVILLIGSGWSFVKPFLTAREKQIILCVLVLQVIDNLALAVLASETEGESLYQDWYAVLHLVDILCCCAVLIPIVWQVNALEKSLEHADPETGEPLETGYPTADDPDAARTLSKLKLFRSFYCLVVAYIYFTRILVYLFAMLDYRHTWVRYLLTELATLAFYVVTGISFRPMPENPYLTVVKQDDDNEEMATEASRNTTTVEMGPLSSSTKDN
jgi:hypothetical protein